MPPDWAVLSWKPLSLQDLPIGVKHDIHEECSNSGKGIWIQAGDAEHITWTGKRMNDRPLNWKRHTQTHTAMKLHLQQAPVSISVIYALAMVTEKAASILRQCLTAKALLALRQEMRTVDNLLLCCSP